VVDAVIFDLDGVIVDSEPVWEEVRRAYVADHGGTWQPDSQHRLMGMSTGEWARYLSSELGVGRPAEQVAIEVIDQMVARYDKHLPLIPGADGVVHRLAERWTLGLASSSPQRLIDATLAAADLTDVFSAALSSESVPNGKPAPDIYLAVARRLSAEPGQVVAIEDSSNGVRSAHNAGMKVVAVPHERYPLDRDAAARAVRTLPSVTDLTVDVVVAAGRASP
jgi:HAD superfamily hydrolase (TIGR01509 family)